MLATAREEFDAGHFRGTVFRPNELPEPGAFSGTNPPNPSGSLVLVTQARQVLQYCAPDSRVSPCKWMQTISLKLPDDLLADLDREAKARRVSKSVLVRESLVAALRQRSRRGAASCYDLAREGETLDTRQKTLPAGKQRKTESAVSSFANGNGQFP